MGVHPDTDDQSRALINEDKRTSADVAHNGPERHGASYRIRATHPAPEAPPEGGNHSSGRTVHSRVGEYGEFHPTNVYDEAERSGRDDVKRDGRTRMDDYEDRGYDPHERY